MRRFLGALAAFVAFIGVASVGYWAMEGPYSLLDGLYMTVISVTTVGYGHVHPLSEVGRLWTMFVILTGVTLGAVTIGLFVAMAVEGQIRKVLGRRHVERTILGLAGHAIVCGYGKMGSLIAQELLARGRRVVVVDNQTERTATAERQGLLTVLGDAQEEASLEAAGIRKAAVLVGALEDDADNVFLTITARQANSSLKIIARAQQAATESILLKAGATRVVCPQIIGANRVVDVITRPAVVDLVEIANKGVELEMDQLVLSATSSLVGQSLQELELPRRTGATVVAVRRSDGTPIYQPTSDLVLKAGDTLVFVGRKGAAAQVQKVQDRNHE